MPKPALLPILKKKGSRGKDMLKTEPLDESDKKVLNTLHQKNLERISRIKAKKAQPIEKPVSPVSTPLTQPTVPFLDGQIDLKSMMMPSKKPA